MTSSPTPEAGYASLGGPRFVQTLPWCVVVGGLVTLTPLVILPEILILIAHLPTFVVLLAYAIDLGRRVRRGQVVSTIAIAGVVGGLGASVALMGLMAIGMLEDGTVGIFYFITWMLLPIFALGGSGLAAALAGLCRVFPRSSKA